MPSKLGCPTGFEPAAFVVECFMGSRSRRRKWTDAEFIDAVKRNITISGVFRDLGISDHGGNYRGFHLHIASLQLPTTHMKGRAHGRTGPRVPLEKTLVRNSTYGGGSSNLRKKLIRAKLLIETCALCGQGKSWKNKPLILQLDHINGDPRDNRIENLRILCPNCHTQTPTFSNRRAKTQKPPCLDCPNEVWGRSLRCVDCENKRRVGTRTKIEWPSLEELETRLATSSFEQVARELSVSSNAIRKRIRQMSSLG